MITTYTQIMEDIELLVDFLESKGIYASCGSYFENDYLLASCFVENHTNGRHDLLDDKGRASLGGLHELYKWIWSIKNSVCIDIIIPHLEMMTESAVRINSETSMINPVTNKQDDSTNKLIETIIAMFAIKVGTQVDLDDPIKSSGGENPDVIFDYSGNRIAIACKTLRGKSPETFIDNFKSAAKQIERASCDHGYIAINAMNIIPHDKLNGHTFQNIQQALDIASKEINDTLEKVTLNHSQHIFEIFSNPKVRPVILIFIHTNTQLHSPSGFISTMIKCTYTKDLKPDSNSKKDIDLLSKINEFIHNKL